MKTKKNAKSARFVARASSRYGETTYRIHDTAKDEILTIAYSRESANGLLRELNRDPKIVPGVRVRFADWVSGYGASEPDALHRVTEERYGAGEEGELAMPHPNQEACEGWWYVAVDSKIGEPRKLLVGVSRDGFVLVQS